MDFRGIRYPSVIGPGVATPGVVQYTSWMIERAAAGHPFAAWVTPETRVPVMYIDKAAAATVQFAQATAASIRTIHYLVDGVKPAPSAAELGDAVRRRVLGAEIAFKPDPAIQKTLDEIVRPLDDSRARDEWGWRPTHDAARIVDDFLAALPRART